MLSFVKQEWLFTLYFFPVSIECKAGYAQQ